MHPGGRSPTSEGAGGRFARHMAGSTLVLVDAGTVAGFRRSRPSLGQLHQAIVHLHRQHPEAQVAVVADPSLKWDLDAGEQTLFEGDIVAGAVVCAPAGAVDGTHGFIARAAEQAAREDRRVVAITDRAVPGVALGKVRVDGGRWLWELDGDRLVEPLPESGTRSQARPRRRRS
jgi:hypothetical protein